MICDMDYEEFLINIWEDEAFFDLPQQAGDDSQPNSADAKMQLSDAER